MRVRAFEDIAAELKRRTERTVWCAMATVDAKGRLRSRIVHPLWEGRTLWLLTERKSPKARDVDRNPFTSLTYIDSAEEQVHVECKTAWEDRLDEKRRRWDWFKSLPQPLGYDPGLFFTKGVEHESFGCMRLDPWRIELWSLADLMAGKPPQVWKA
jgi:general stress protein 26